MTQNLLIFVHGLGGHRTKTWGKFPELVESDSDLGSAWRVGYYSFPTGLFSWPGRGIPRVQLLSLGLRTEIDVRHHDAPRVALACHSLGGVVARRYLLDEVKRRAPLRVTNLLLFATPNDGSSLASVGRFVSVWNRQLRQLSRDSDVLNDLNADWRALDVDSKLDTHCIVGGSDSVVSHSSARTLWGDDRVSVSIESGHVSLVKPTSPDSLSFQILKAQLLPRRSIASLPGHARAPSVNIAPIPSPTGGRDAEFEAGRVLQRMRALLQDPGRLSPHEARLGGIHEVNLEELVRHLARAPDSPQLHGRNLLRDELGRARAWIDRQPVTKQSRDPI